MRDSPVEYQGTWSRNYRLILQITNHKSQITNHKSQITNHKSQITNRKSQINLWPFRLRFVWRGNSCVRWRDVPAVSVSAAHQNKRSSAFRRGEADGSHHAHTKPWVCVMNPSGERAVRGGKHDSLVTNAECARRQIPDAPLPPPSQGTRLRISGLSRFLCLSFFAAAKKVSAAPHRGNANNPIRIQGKANAMGKQTHRKH